MFQKTIKKPVSFSGIGLHTGEKSTIFLKPAPADTGIIFILNNKKIRLSPDNISDTTRSINIGTGKERIMTVEHLSAALYMSGITNLYIHMDNNEVPAADGSSMPFIKLINRAGTRIQKKPVKKLGLDRPIRLIDKDRFIIGLPSDRLKITYGIDFDHPVLKNQSIHLDNITLKTFNKQIAPARTFGFEKEVDSLRKRGLALGGSLKNAVVLTDIGYLNKKLRFKDECIRHKVLDFLAMLSLLNQPIYGHFILYRSGHEFDLKFIKLLKRGS